MKRLNLLMLLCSLFVTVSLMESCVEDPCENVDCGFGTCFEGDCNCDTGYEADADGSCTVLIREKFLGSFSVSETCSTGNYNYSSDIIVSSSDNLTIVFTNLYDNNEPINAVIDTDGATLTIAEQTFDGAGTISGSGTIDKDTGVITITYTATSTGGTDNCTATFTPQ